MEASQRLGKFSSPKEKKKTGQVVLCFVFHFVSLFLASVVTAVVRSGVLPQVGHGAAVRRGASNCCSPQLTNSYLKRSLTVHPLPPSSLTRGVCNAAACTMHPYIHQINKCQGSIAHQILERHPLESYRFNKEGSFDSKEFYRIFGGLKPLGFFPTLVL